MNAGKGVVTFSGSVGRGELKGPVFIELWTAAQTSDPLNHALRLSGDVSFEKSGRVTTVSGGNQGRVVFSGASFALPGASALEIKPLKSAK